MTDPNRPDRDRRVVAMRLGGASYQAIAAAVGLRSRSSAHAAFPRALAAEPLNDVARARAAELERLDRLQLAVWGQALRGDLAAVDRVLRIMDSRCRLLGLAAPAASSGGPPVPPSPPAPLDPVAALVATRAVRRAGLPSGPPAGP